MIEQLHAALDKAFSLPGIRQWRQGRYDAGFRQGQYGGECRGVYRSYAEAAAAAPRTLPLGYDHDAPAAMYRDRIDRVFPSDYPLIHWLGVAFAAGAEKVFDLGGHVGVSYYSYQKYLAFPPKLAWRVSDVPAVMRSGEELARTRDARRALSFVPAFDAASEADVIFTSGCLQYLEKTFGQLLATLPRRPEWLLVNLLPLHESEAFWTVQSIGTAFCPYRIQCRKDFIAELEALGYEVLDQWSNPEKRCRIAFDPAHSIEGYWGAALRLRGHGAV
jgi:putative methyltransferase (TIGR04325 family)